MLARLFALAPAARGRARRGRDLVVHAGRLIADASRPAAGPSTITIVDGRIQSVTAGLTPAPAGARLIDLSSQTVLPGLIDMHVHLSGDPGGDLSRRGGGHRRICGPGRRQERAADRCAPASPRCATSARRRRSASRSPRHRRRADPRAAHRRLRARPSRSSAAMATSPASGPRWSRRSPPTTPAPAPVQCAERVRELARAGAAGDQVHRHRRRPLAAGARPRPHFTDEEMSAIVTTAHSLGLKVAAHAHGARGIEAAARAGVDSIEHGTFADAAAIAGDGARRHRHGADLDGLHRHPRGARQGILHAGRRGEGARDAGPGRQGRPSRRAAGVPVVFGTDAARLSSMAATPRNSPCWSSWPE